MGARYDEDVLAWSVEQAGLLRAGRFGQLDIEHLADEIEDLGRSEKRELASRLAVLLAHLLKWQAQPARRSASWQRTIREQRKQVRYKLRETPSLLLLLSDPEWVGNTWSQAVTLAVAETELDAFPEACPWTVDEVLVEEWMPG